MNKNPNSKQGSHDIKNYIEESEIENLKRKLISGEIQINERFDGKAQRSILHLSIFSNQFDFTVWLLERFASNLLNLEDGNFLTPIFTAVRFSDVSTIVALLTKGAHLGKLKGNNNKKGLTPLIWAINSLAIPSLKGCLCVEFLCDEEEISFQEISPNHLIFVVDDYRVTFLFQDEKSRRPQMFLLESKKREEINNLFTTSKDKGVVFRKIRTNEMINLNSRDSNYFKNFDDRHDIFSVINMNKENINISYENIEINQTIIEKIVDILVIKHLKNRHRNILFNINFLLSLAKTPEEKRILANPKLNDDNYARETPIHAIARVKDYPVQKIIETLLEFGASLRVVNETQQTPFHVAVENENLNFIKYILDKKNRINIGDIKFLINHFDKNGNTPLHFLLNLNFSKKITIEIFNFMIEYMDDQNLNIPNENGDTLINMAVKLNIKEVFQLLLKRGASCYLINQEGSIPSDSIEYRQEISEDEKRKLEELNKALQENKTETILWFYNYDFKHISKWQMENLNSFLNLVPKVAKFLKGYDKNDTSKLNKFINETLYKVSNKLQKGELCNFYETLVKEFYDETINEADCENKIETLNQILNLKANIIWFYSQFDSKMEKETSEKIQGFETLYRYLAAKPIFMNKMKELNDSFNNSSQKYKEELNDSFNNSSQKYKISNEIFEHWNKVLPLLQWLSIYYSDINTISIYNSNEDIRINIRELTSQTLILHFVNQSVTAYWKENTMIVKKNFNHQELEILNISSDSRIINRDDRNFMFFSNLNKICEYSQFDIVIEQFLNWLKYLPETLIQNVNDYAFILKTNEKISLVKNELLKFNRNYLDKVLTDWVEQILQFRPINLASQVVVLPNNVTREWDSLAYDIRNNNVVRAEIIINLISPRIRNNLKSLRGYLKTSFKDENIFTSLNHFSSEMKKIVSEICSYAVQWLGSPPCNYVILGVGSFSRNTVYPNSDLDFVILIEDISFKKNDYFLSLIKGIESIIKFLFEPINFTKEGITEAGFHIDRMYADCSNYLITIEDAVKVFRGESELNDNLQFSLFNTCLLFSPSETNSTLFDNLHVHLTNTIENLRDNNITKIFWEKNLKTFLKIINNEGNENNAKKNYLNFLSFLITLYSFHFRIPNFTKMSLREMLIGIGYYLEEDYYSCLKWSVEFLLRLRLEIYFGKHKTDDDIFILNDFNSQTLLTSYNNTILPFKILSLAEFDFSLQRNFDPRLECLKLIQDLYDKKTLNENQAFTIIEVSTHNCMFKKDIDLNDIITYLRHIPGIFRSQFINHLSNLKIEQRVIEKLKLFPYSNGYRQLVQEKNDSWKKTLKSLTDSNPHPLIKIKVQGASVDDYLHPDIVQRLIDDNWLIGFKVCLVKEINTRALPIIKGNFIIMVKRNEYFEIYLVINNNWLKNEDTSLKMKIFKKYIKANFKFKSENEMQMIENIDESNIKLGDMIQEILKVFDIKVVNYQKKKQILKIEAKKLFTIDETDEDEENEYLIQDKFNQENYYNNFNLEKKQSNNPEFGLINGNHLVIPIIHNDKKVHVKVMPDFPGMEILYMILANKLIGCGYPNVELWKLTINERPYPALISQTIEGELLDDELVLKYPLNLNRFSKLVIMSLLLNSGDGNPGNFLANITRNKNGKYELVLNSIDNDKIFAVPLDGNNLGIVTILYCFEEMDSPIDHMVREEILNISALDLLYEFIEELKQINDINKKLFENELDKYLRSEQEFCYILSMLNYKHLKEVFLNLKLIQYHLRDNPEITHLELLSKLHPSVANYYNFALQENMSALERFEFISRAEFKQQIIGKKKRFVSTSSADEYIFKFLNPKNLVSLSRNHIIEQYNKDFDLELAYGLLRRLDIREEKITSAKNQLLKGNFEEFKLLDLYYAQEKILSEISLCEVTSEELQDQFLDVLLNLNNIHKFENFTLNSCKSLTDLKLFNILNKCQKMNALKLKDCPNIKMTLNREFYFLTHLILENLEGIEKLDLSTTILEKAFINNMKYLRYLKLKSPNLKTLNLSGCIILNQIELDGNQLIDINLSKCKSLDLNLLKSLVMSSPRLELLKLHEIDPQKIKYSPLYEFMPELINSELKENDMAKLSIWIMDIMSNQNDTFNLSGIELPNVILKTICKAIKFNFSIKFLYLEFCKIEIMSSTYIADLIEKNNTIKIIRLGFNLLQNEGAIKIAKSLEKNNSIIEIDLSGNKIDNEGAIFFGNAIRNNPNLGKVKLDFNKIGDAGIKEITYSMQTRNVGLSENDEFSCVGNSITQEGITSVMNLINFDSSIKHLILMGNNISWKGAEILSKFLKDNKSLKALGLCVNKIGNKGVQFIGTALFENKELEILDLFGCDITDKGALYISDLISKNKKIKALSVGGNRITSVGIKPLSIALTENKSIETIKFGSFILNCGVINYIIDGNNIGNLGTEYLADILDKNSSLNCLCLIGCNISDDGAIYLIKKIQSSRKRFNLDLDFNNISETIALLFISMNKLIYPLIKISNKNEMEIDINRQRASTYYLSEKNKIIPDNLLYTIFLHCPSLVNFIPAKFRSVHGIPQYENLENDLIQILNFNTRKYSKDLMKYLDELEFYKATSRDFYGKALSYSNHHRYEEVLEILNNLIKKNSEESSYSMLRGNSNLMLGKTKESIYDYNVAISIEKKKFKSNSYNNSNGDFLITETMSSCYHNLGCIYNYFSIKYASDLLFKEAILCMEISNKLTRSSSLCEHGLFLYMHGFIHNKRELISESVDLFSKSIQYKDCNSSLAFGQTEIYSTPLILKKIIDVETFVTVKPLILSYFLLIRSFIHLNYENKEVFEEYKNFKMQVNNTNDRIGKILLRDLKIGDEIHDDYEEERNTLINSIAFIKEEIIPDYLRDISTIIKL